MDAFQGSQISASQISDPPQIIIHEMFPLHEVEIRTHFCLSKLQQLTSRLSCKQKSKGDYVLFRKCAAVNCDDLLEGGLFKFS